MAGTYFNVFEEGDHVFITKVMAKGEVKTKLVHFYDEDYKKLWRQSRYIREDVEQIESEGNQLDIEAVHNNQPLPR